MKGAALGVLQSFRGIGPRKCNDAIKAMATAFNGWWCRHPQRFESVVRLFAKQDCASPAQPVGRYARAETDIWVGDSLGEMALYWHGRCWPCWGFLELGGTKPD